MTVLPTVSMLAISAVLLSAALGKLRAPRVLAATAERLGIPPALALPAAFTLASAELILGSAVLFRPDHLLVQGGVLVLALVFALAGFIALRLDEPVRCHCFGAAGGVLGKRQIFALGPWIAAVAALRLGERQPPPVQAGAEFFGAIALAIAAIHGAAVYQEVKASRSDRHAAEEMFEWLPSR